jgi:hypothetical protein
MWAEDSRIQTVKRSTRNHTYKPESGTGVRTISNTAGNLGRSQDIISFAVALLSFAESETMKLLDSIKISRIKLAEYSKVVS